MIPIIEHFGDAGGSKREGWRRQQQLFRLQQNEQKQDQKTLERTDDTVLAYGVTTIMANEMEIRAFETHLDTYDEATVKALLENQKLLDINQQLLNEVRTRIDNMLDQAYVMEDGRRVFKTEDGTQVFDEFGNEVSENDLDFELIDTSRPSWEDYSADINREKELLAQRENLLNNREDIIAYQEKLDDAREKIADGEISKAELDELKAELDEDMPPQVKAHIPGLNTPNTTPPIKSEYTQAAMPVDQLKQAVTVQHQPDF